MNTARRRLLLALAALPAAWMHRPAQPVRLTDATTALRYLREEIFPSARQKAAKRGETDGAGKLAPISSEQFEKLVVDFFVSKT